MKNVEQIIAEKQAEIQRLQNEIAALKNVIPLLAEVGSAPQNSRPASPSLAAASPAAPRVKQPINVTRRISLQT
jgi:hypothetical protein